MKHNILNGAGKRKPVFLTLAALTLAFAMLLTGCSGKSEDSRGVVYEDMEAAFEQSGLRSANIGIFKHRGRFLVLTSSRSWNAEGGSLRSCGLPQ